MGRITPRPQSRSCGQVVVKRVTVGDGGSPAGVIDRTPETYGYRTAMMTATKAFASLLALLLVCAAPVSATAQDAMLDAYVAHVKGDDATAISLWRALAEDGDVEAAFMLAETYLKGPPAVADRALALDWYRFAAERGHVEARFALGERSMAEGERLLPGKDAAPYFVEAAHWFSLAAEAGYAPARHQLGRLHLNGTGVAEDAGTVRELWTLAAAQGYRESYEALPLFGHAVPEETMDLWVKFDALMTAGNRPGQDFFPRFLRPLAERGHMEAQYTLGSLHIIRPEQMPDPDEAERWLSAARAQGVPLARFFLVNLALKRAGRGTAQ